jgi:MFS family permease
MELIDNNKLKHDPFSALRINEFKFFLINKFFLSFGIQMQSVIVGWQVYEITGSVMALGLIGLAEAIPFIIVSLFAGHIADTFNRKRIILLFSILLILATFILYYFSLEFNKGLIKQNVTPIFILIGAIGVIRGFLSAAFPSIMSQIVPRSEYANASTWNSTIWHIASVLGPSCAGFLIYKSYSTAYFIDILIIFISFVAFLFVKSKPIPIKEKVESLAESLSAGIKFVFKNQLVLGALSLDLFAVLFGGAVAMLPAFADKVLHAGAIELGFLRAAPAVGAIVMALIIAYYPLTKNAGRNLFISVGAFGISTILFGICTNFYWAILFLFLTGAFDNVSVVIRHTILQLATPDDMRGRVSSVNGIFIGSSNEIGAFESGVTARAFGLKPSIVIGGIMTVVVVILISKLAPKLKKLDLNDLK